MTWKQLTAKGKNVRYSGVAISALLATIDTAQGETLRGDWLRAFAVVDARDAYRVVFALPDFDAEFTDRALILADERVGKPLDSDSRFEIIVPGENRYGRWVRRVNEIRLMDSSSIKDWP